MSKLTESTEWKTWMEQVLRDADDEDELECMAVAMCSRDGSNWTGYYNCTAHNIADMIGGLQRDFVMKVVKENAEEIREMLEDDDD